MNVAKRRLQPEIHSRPWTRRAFVQSVGGLAVAGGVLGVLPRRTAAAEVPEPSPSQARGTRDKERYRAVSWWLEWPDLAWPNPDLMDKVRRRADRCAASGVNCCIIFGAHFRWDFMPVWGRVHDLLRFIGEELRQRQIVLFDHHSSVLTHRPRNRDEALNIWRRNRHHVPFYPSRDTAATWTFAGSRLNDWRMIDVQTGEPVYLPSYNAEQFCMNNPAFRQAYVQYIKLLLTETRIDGLMSDDGIFYADWQSCACEHCRQRFKKECDRTLPAVSDTEFWGNRRNAAFQDWVDMRFRSCGDFLVDVQQALPAGFPLLTCCSSSEGQMLPAFGMSYQDFIRSCNHVLLEMCGSTPTTAGTWDDRIPSQLLHLAIARDHRAPCFGLGYGFFPDTAFFIWALNKFLGSDCWFSTLKGRLSATSAQLGSLADDSELVGEGYRWEQNHSQLFKGEADTDIAVYFSRPTRDCYGQVPADYVADYQASCLQLMRAGRSCEVVTEVPAAGKTRFLILSSAACLSPDERNRLDRFLQAGGTVIATGPTGHYDARANPAAVPWLHAHGIPAELTEPARLGAFPPYSNLKPPVDVARCHLPESFPRLEDGWAVVPVQTGRLLWRPERITEPGIAAAVLKLLPARAGVGIEVGGLPSGWQVRGYRDGNRLLIHALPAKVGVVLHPDLQNEFNGQRIVEKLLFTALTRQLVLTPQAKLNQVLLHSPDLPAPRAGKRVAGLGWEVDPSGVSRYFILECS